MAVLDMQTVLLAGSLAILIAIAISLKALFAIERRLFRMESHILKLSNKILEEEDEIELLLRPKASSEKKVVPVAKPETKARASSKAKKKRRK
jgi:hypothetical protein